MKNENSLTAWLFSPFKFIAGSKALALGLLVMILLSILGYLSHSHFNGAIGMQYASSSDSTPYTVHAFYQLSAWFSLTLTFYIAARIVSKSAIRLIDIAGTMALSQIPCILFALLGFIPAIHLDFGNMNTLNIAEILNILKENIGILVLVSTVGLIPIVWSIVLKYNAYSISGNIKGLVGGISFAIALVISEILSKVINYIVIPLL